MLLCVVKFTPCHACKLSILPFSGRLLRAQRQRQGMYQQDLANRCAALGRPIDRSQISRFERDERRPNPRDLKAIVEALGIDVDALLDENQAVA